MPPGDYDLVVEVYSKPTGCLVDPLARQLVHVTVTTADAARGELALPEIAATIRPVPVVGDTPVLAFQSAGSTGGTLADYPGRYTLVHFWRVGAGRASSNCQRCGACMNDMRLVGWSRSAWRSTTIAPCAQIGATLNGVLPSIPPAIADIKS